MVFDTAGAEEDAVAITPVFALTVSDGEETYTNADDVCNSIIE